LPQTPDANSWGESAKITSPEGIDRASAAKAKGQELTRHVLLFSREISRSRLLLRVPVRQRKREGDGQGERERERRGRADIELHLAAPLLESTGRSPLP